jgi:hypothetical protein
MNEDPASVVFGVGVDRFRLGMGVTAAVAVLSNDYPRLNFEINFPRVEKVLNQEVIISVLGWGIRLRFLPVSQKLYMVDYYDISQRRFSIKGSVFGGQDEGAAATVTFDMLHKYLGPTLPGTIIEDEYFLCNFGGASFLFAVPSEHLKGMKSHPHLPVTFADGSSAHLVRIFVYPMDLDITSPKTYPDVLAARVTVVLKNESSSSGHLSIFISSGQLVAGGAKGVCGAVELGMSLQDIISMLGDPAVAGINTGTHSYRYEYPQLGLEFYFSESTHILFQVVLRNNLAHSTDFGRFERCPFRIYYTHPGEDIVNPPYVNPPPVISSPSSRHPPGAASLAAADPSLGPLEINSITLKTNNKNGNHKAAANSDSNGKAEGGPGPSSSSTFDVIYGPSNESAYIDPLTADVGIRELMSGWFGGSAMTREASAQLPSPTGSPFADTLLYAYPEVIVCVLSIVAYPLMF